MASDSCYESVLRCFFHGSSGATFWHPQRKRMVLPVLALTATLVVALALAVPHAGDPEPAGGAWPALDLAASASLPRYAFAQVQDSTPPTFVASELDSDAGVLTITFSETIDAASIVPAKIHVRESGNYSGGTTLTAGEFVTVADGATISFALTEPHRAAIARLATPELTIEPGAVRDASGNLIVGTFDASTRTFVDATSIRPQENAPTDIAFSNDGTKMFVMGTVGDDVNEYTLSTPFDASTLTFVDATSIRPQENAPTDMVFSNDGTKMFVIGTVGDDVNEYTLSTPFDVSTLTFVDATSISSQDGQPRGMVFSNDGTKMFVIGTVGDDVNEYALSTPFDASTLTFVDATSISSQVVKPQGIAFSNDGTKMFVLDNAGDDVNEYALSTPFDASTLTFVDATSISSEETFPTGMVFLNDGTKMFIIGIIGDDVNEYDLSSVYPITVTRTPPIFVASELDIDAGVLTITFSETIDAASIVPAKIHVRESGNYAGGTTLTADELGTDADSTTISFALTPSHRAAVAGLAAPELTIEPGAVRDASGNLIVGTFDVSTQTFVDATSIRSQETQPRDIAFSNDGTKMFIVGDVRDKVNEYTLSTPFDASTLEFVDATSIRAQDDGPRGMAFSNDGTKLFVIGYYGKEVNEYTLSTPFDASTLTFVDSTSIRLQETDPRSVAFSNDGTKMFVMGVVGDDVNEYTLSTPFDASTLTFVDATSISSEETFPTGMVFSNDGTKMFVIGWEEYVNEYALSTPFDASTRTFVDDTSISSEEVDSQGIAFSNDGAKMFIIGVVGDDVNEYDLSSVYPVTVTRAPPMAAGALVTLWNVAASPHTISMPLNVHSGGTLSIDWGDNSTDTVAANGTQSHTYSASGEYQVSMTGDLSRIILGAAGGTPSKLASIDQWGDIEWISMQDAFRDASNMEYHTTDAPDLSRVISMQNMFRAAASFDGDLSSWNVSAVANMDGAFRGASAFKGDISTWDMSGVTDMRTMFQDAAAFNGDISGWNVSKVTHMNSMFHNASSFNQPLDSWNVPSVKNMSFMFSEATYFDQPLGSWDVSSVADMNGMFTNANSFQQNLGKWYIVLDDMTIDYDDAPGVVGGMSAQNPFLDGQNPAYGIGQGGDSDSFGLNGSSLVLKAVPAKRTYAVNVTSTGDFGTGNSKMIEVAVSGFNYPPTVDAGEDQSVQEGTAVTLSGTAADNDGDQLAYRWSHDSTLPIVFANDTSPSTTFAAPAVDADTAVTFTLTVDDGTTTTTDSLVVTITDIPAVNSTPVVDAGHDQIVLEGSIVTLTATTTDADDNQLAHTWTYHPLLNLTLTHATTTSPWFTAPDVNANTTITFTLTADDGTAEVSDSVDILIMSTQNVHPVLDVIQEQAVDEMSTLIFVARATDEDLPSDTLTYGLEDPTAGASMDPATGAFTWTPTEDQNGIHTVTVTVSDGRGGTDSQDVKVTVNEVNMPPTLDVIPAQTIDELAMLTFTANASDDDLHPGVGIEVVAGKLKIPWSIDWTPDWTALFTERGGDLRIIRDGILLPDPIFSVDVNDDAEGGLLGIAVDPEFEENQYIYLYQTYKTDGTTLNKVVRYTLANVTVSEDLVLVDGIPGASYHDGGRIQFGPDGNLYITTGDAGNPSLAQDLDSLAGKILRITREGAIPQDNPFSNSAVWSWGHRNPQGMDWDGSGNLIATEHGPSGERGEAHDEINLILPGANYGWPETVGDESMEGMQDPLLHTGSETWAPSGSEFYDGDMIPGWTGKYFVANLRGEHLRMIDLDLSNNGTHSHEGLFEGQFGRLRDVQTGPDGFLYLLTSNRDGRGSPVSNDDRILKIVPVFDSALSRPANVLTYGLEASPAGASMDPATGTFTWRPAEDQNGIHTITVTVSDGNGGTNSQEVQVTVNVVNVAPIVDAGSDQTALEGQTVMLNGTATDADGDSLTYLWSHNSSLAIQLANSTSPSTTFAAPAVDADTAVTFTLTVDDGTTTATDSFEVTVTDIQILNSPPVADAGSDQTALEGQTVMLNGTATDADGDSLTYLWSHNSSLAIQLANSTSPSTTFTVPAVDADTAVTFTLTVDDGIGISSDQVTITIDHNDLPTVKAGADQTVQEGQTVMLNGTAADNDGDQLTYRWSHDSTLPIVFANDASLSTTFAAPAVDADTEIIFTLTVNDGLTDSTDTVLVTVNDVPDDSDFVTTWETVLPGESITIPARGTYTIDWGDGTVDARVTRDQTHTYADPGNHTVRISEGITGIYLNNHADAPNLRSIDQWGDAEWRSMYSSFMGASNMVLHATDAPDLSRVTDTSYMFLNASSFDGDLSAWDLSHITSMTGMFWGASSFDGDLSAWDVSSVTDMYTMFYNAISFDGDISTWDVSRVRNMANMFHSASSFEGDISAWDVSSVTDMYAMFLTASSFNGDISGWDVSRVTDMVDMFHSASSFNGDISGWDVSSTTRMNNMFYSADSFDQNMGSWYIVLDDAVIDRGSVPGDVGRIAAQNAFLDSQNPAYGIGSGGDSDYFEIDGSILKIKSVPDGHAGPYSVTITSAGTYGSENSRTFEISVTDGDGNTSSVTPSDPRSVGEIILSSTLPGTIQIDWDAPGEEPREYRITWAKSGEEFPNWRDPVGNAFPTGSSYTITGLDEDEEYHVKVRARYDSGGPGPWGDISAITVAGSG